jgi:hypothetical protein
MSRRCLRFVPFFSVATIIFISVPLVAKPKMAARIGVAAGRTAPMSEPLSEYVDSGEALQLKLFGGAKIKKKAGIGAVGLGWDITYSRYKLKNELEGHYRRYLWDWFFLPISLGPLVITPGLAWNVTDIHLPEYGIKEISVRPAAVLAVGLQVGILPHLALTAQARGEAVVDDREKPHEPAPFEKLDITGNFWTATIGVMGYL